MPYAELKLSRSEFITIRGLQYHIRHWGESSAPKLFLLHGWMDVSASFQFMVDCLQQDWHIIAPDWRGFGLTERSGAGGYWFPDYVADLDAILHYYAPDNAVNLLGHSMGGNVACIYAGVRPEKINKLINLEGFGMPNTFPAQAPGRFTKWLNELRQEPKLRSYATKAEVAERLQINNPRLSDVQADFLSGHWARQEPSGEWHILADPMHKQTGPLLYHIEDVLACWQAITAPVLWVEAVESELLKRFGDPAQVRQEIDRRISFISNVKYVAIPDAGHMLHHDQSTILAEIIESFLSC